MPATTNDLRPSRLKPGELRDLAEKSGNPCVSILLPTHRSGPETQQGSIRLKNLLGEARLKLEAAGADCSILDPVDALPSNADFWQHQSDGLALFLTPHDCRLIKLPKSVDEHVSLGESFFLLPLIRYHRSDDGYFVLSVTWDEARLFRSGNGILELVETEALPAKYHDLVLPRDTEESIQNTSHRSLGDTGGTSTAMFHGQGEGEDKIEADRNQYLSLVGDQVSRAIYNTGMPLVVVATTEVIGHFEATTDLVADTKVNGSPSQWSDHELYERVNEAVTDQIRTENAGYPERFGTALAQSKASTDAEKILLSAKAGRVDTVAVCRSEIGSDQANTIVGETLRQGGDAFCCDAEEMPENAKVAAIFRY